MIVIKFMPDYECWPLWHVGPDHFGDIDPRELGLSNDLVKDIENWTIIFDATLNQDDPRNSGFVRFEDEKKFVENGFSLAERLASELRKTHRILFYYTIKNIVEVQDSHPVVLSR